MGELRPCPFCSEMIQQRAIKCRFCDSRLDGAGGGAPAVPPSRRRPSGTTPLVLGLLACPGFIFCGAFIFLGPFAWWTANRHAEECRELGFEPSSEATTGKILGIVATSLLILGVMVLALVVAVAIGANH